MTASVLIELKNITKRFSSGSATTTVLDDVTLTIRHGEFVALVGPSGSGKTTLTHIIGGLLQPTSGKVLIDGIGLNQKSDKQLSYYRNKQVGFVFQNFSLLPDYTALENVSVPLLLAGMDQQGREQKAKYYLTTMGLEQKLHHFPAQLSGGQRQRVSIARALAVQPNILIADEPTGSLDTQRGEEIITILEQLNRQKGVTLLLVTHNAELAERADRIIHIQDGKTREVLS